MRAPTFLTLAFILAGIMAAGNMVGQHQAEHGGSVENATIDPDELNASTPGGDLGDAWGEAIGLTVTALYNGVAEYSFNNPDWAGPRTVFNLLKLLLAVYIVRLAIIPVAVIVTAGLELYRQQKQGDQS